MKKALVLATVLVAVTALGASAGGMGAVKVAFEPDVGWVIFNTTGSGRLNATAHVQGGLPNEEFSVSVRARYEDNSVEVFSDVAILTTNENGEGNAHVQLRLDPPAGSRSLRRLAFRVRSPGPPNVVYVAIAWDTPLKKKGMPMRQAQ